MNSQYHSCSQHIYTPATKRRSSLLIDSCNKRIKRDILTPFSETPQTVTNLKISSKQYSPIVMQTPIIIKKPCNSSTSLLRVLDNSEKKHGRQKYQKYGKYNAYLVGPLKLKSVTLKGFCEICITT